MHKKEIPEFIEKEKNIKASEGLVFLIDFPKKFSAKTIIKQAKSDNNPDPQNLEKISSKNSEFDKNFIIFSNSGIEFNDLFRNEFMADFLSLFETFETPRVAAAAQTWAPSAPRGHTSRDPVKKKHALGSTQWTRLSLRLLWGRVHPAQTVCLEPPRRRCFVPVQKCWKWWSPQWSRYCTAAWGQTR